jgi:hypothetical protein
MRVPTHVRRSRTQPAAASGRATPANRSASLHRRPSQWVRFVTGDVSPMAHFPVFDRPMRFCGGFVWLRLASFRRDGSMRRRFPTGLRPSDATRPTPGPAATSPARERRRSAAIGNCREFSGVDAASQLRRLVETIAQDRTFSDIFGHPVGRNGESWGILGNDQVGRPAKADRKGRDSFVFCRWRPSRSWRFILAWRGTRVLHLFRRAALL